MSNITDYASEAQITRAIIPMLAERAWVDANPAYAQRAGQIAALIRFADEPRPEVAELLAGTVEMGEAINVLARRVGFKPLTRKGASALITWLGTLPKVAKVALDKGVTLTGEAAERKVPSVSQEGFYLRPDGNAYRVRESRRNPGRFYAEAPNGKGWDREAGAIFTLSPEMLMSAADVARFGVRVGICLNCGRSLTDPISKATGLGTDCGPRVLGNASYRAARRHAIATSEECAAYHAQQLANQRARRAARKARAA